MVEIIVKKGPADKRKGITILRQKRVKLTREDWRGLDKKKFDENYDKIKWKEVKKIVKRGRPKKEKTRSKSRT